MKLATEDFKIRMFYKEIGSEEFEAKKLLEEALLYERGQANHRKDVKACSLVYHYAREALRDRLLGRSRRAKKHCHPTQV